MAEVADFQSQAQLLLEIIQGCDLPANPSHHLASTYINHLLLARNNKDLPCAEKC